MRVRSCVCVHTCVCVHACNGCAATVSVWVVYGSYCAPSSCSSVSHVTGWAFVIGWERNRRGGNAGMDVRREEVRRRGGVRGMRLLMLDVNRTQTDQNDGCITN